MKNGVIALDQTLREIREAETAYGRMPNSVRLLAVSKTRRIEEITTIAQKGQCDFAENYVQEALNKINNIHDPALIWHFIGPVQSNKTRLIALNFDWVHSIDRLKIAARLNDARPDNMAPLNVCIQINISGEPSKSGIEATELDALIEKVVLLPRLRLRGLMALPAPTDDFQQQCAAFELLKSLFDERTDQLDHWDTLSMGTTRDMQAAIASGATMVRIGTAIFGPRHNAG